MELSNSFLPFLDSKKKNNVGIVPILGNVNYAAGANWTGGIGGAFGNPGNLSTTYTPSPTDIANDSVVLYLTSAGSFFSCPNHVDSVTIHFTESPSVFAGADLVVIGSAIENKPEDLNWLPNPAAFQSRGLADTWS